MNRKKKFTFGDCNNLEMENAFEEILSLSPGERSQTEGYRNYTQTITSSRYRSHTTLRTSDYEEMSTTEQESFEETTLDEDDEVFLDTEKSNGIAIIQRRSRRASDVVDTIPSMSPNFHTEGGYLMSSHRRLSFHSPPGTPGSDGGYSSTAIPSPQLTDFPPYRTRWDRMSLPERVPFVPSNPLRKSNIRDSTDANPMQPQSQPNNMPPYSSSEAKMPVPKDSLDYNMNHKYRGPAIIFNNIVFSTHNERGGSDVDVKRLIKVFEKLDFDVQSHNDLGYKEMIDLLDSLASKDYSECDCFALIILTHGSFNDLLFTKDSMYHLQDVLAYFLPNKCPSLAGKPKLFFVQACRGRELDHGMRLISYSSRDPRTTETDSGCTSYKIPTMSDYLFGQSSHEGFFSFRNPEKGSWYIQCLCDILEEYHETTDLLKMMTMVSRKVALEYESFNDFQYSLHEKKQIPTVTHTLIRDVYFRPKSTEAGSS